MEFTERDIELVVLQCQHQRITHPRDFVRFAFAYARARSRYVRDDIYDCFKLPEFWRNEMQYWAWLVDERNASGYRQVPVHFQNLKTGLEPRLIPSAMENLLEAVADHRIEPDQAYVEFERIHPYIDGNGRVGHLMWALMCQWHTGVWPNELPPQHNW